MGERIERKEAQSLDEVIGEFLQKNRLAGGVNRQRIFDAWDTVSEAGRYTVNRYVRGGVLYCTISSSVIRSELALRKDEVLKRMNDFLAADRLFAAGDTPEKHLLKNIVLK